MFPELLVFWNIAHPGASWEVGQGRVGCTKKFSVTPAHFSFVLKFKKFYVYDV